MEPTKHDYSKINKIALELGLVKTGDNGQFRLYTKGTSIWIDLSDSGDDIKSIAKNIIRNIKLI